MASPPQRVCVTGGGGFIASWLVKLLLSRGYSVHATLRDPGMPFRTTSYFVAVHKSWWLMDEDDDFSDDPKNAHLMKLDGAPENLTLFKADVLHYDSLKAAIVGCEGVFHVASPVPENKIVDPEASVDAFDILIFI